MATQCHTYQNIESTYQVVAENTVQTASEYTDLNDNTVSSSTPVSSKSSRLPKRFVRQINYTDILLDSPDVPGCNEIAIQEINEDIVSPIGAKTRPEPPPKPRKNKILAKSVENDNVGIEIAEKKETDEETEDSTNHKKERQSHYGRHMITSILFILVIVAIGIATSAITLAVLNFKRYQTCQEHSEYCTIDPEVNYTCSIHSNFKFKNTRLNSHCEYSSRWNSTNMDLRVIATLRIIQGSYYCNCYIPSNERKALNIEINCTLIETVCI